MEKIYHIYLKDQCILHSLKEEEFNKTWNVLKNLMCVLGESDLSYEELSINNEVVLNSSY